MIVNMTKCYSVGIYVWCDRVLQRGDLWLMWPSVTAWGFVTHMTECYSAGICDWCDRVLQRGGLWLMLRLILCVDNVTGWRTCCATWHRKEWKSATRWSGVWITPIIPRRSWSVSPSHCQSYRRRFQRRCRNVIQMSVYVLRHHRSLWLLCSNVFARQMCEHKVPHHYRLWYSRICAEKGSEVKWVGFNVPLNTL